MHGESYGATNKGYILKPGTFCLVPRNTVHYFKITSKENCRALNIYTPAGFEEGLMENAAKAESLSLAPKGLKLHRSDGVMLMKI